MLKGNSTSAFHFSQHNFSLTHFYFFVTTCVCVWTQRYGLWDHEGPLEEQSPSSESCKDEEKNREEDEDGSRKGGGGEEEEKGRVSSTSILENLEMTEQDHLEKVGVNT